MDTTASTTTPLSEEDTKKKNAKLFLPHLLEQSSNGTIFISMQRWHRSLRLCSFLRGMTRQLCFRLLPHMRQVSLFVRSGRSFLDISVI